MYTATMEYQFKPGMLERGLDIWEKIVLPGAKGRKGLHRMLVLNQEGDRLLALGVWEDKTDAEDFMRTGIFKRLMEELTPLLVRDPLPRIWTLVTEI